MPRLVRSLAGFSLRANDHTGCLAASCSVLCVRAFSKAPQQRHKFWPNNVAESDKGEFQHVPGDRRQRRIGSLGRGPGRSRAGADWSRSRLCPATGRHATLPPAAHRLSLDRVSPVHSDPKSIPVGWPRAVQARGRSAECCQLIGAPAHAARRAPGIGLGSSRGNPNDSS